MPRKVFMSVLGTGFYSACSYGFEGRQFTKTRFIQQAMIEAYGVKEWKESDAVCLLLTSGARNSNWECKLRKNPRTGEEETYSGLKYLIESMRLNAEVREVDIADGKTEEEMWQIFQSIYDVLKEGDELYVDLTHSFRYIPMLMLVLMNYAKFLKGVEVKGISYGNFEARDSDNVAPIVDLMPLVRLQEWSIAASEFIKSGMVGTMEKLSAEVSKPILRDTKGSNKEAKAIDKFVGGLRRFVEVMHMCRGVDIVNSNEYRQLLKNHTDYVQSSGSMIRPLRPIVDKVMASFIGFSKYSSSANMLVSAEWALKKEDYQSTVTLLQEGILSLLCERSSLPLNEPDYRDCAIHAVHKIQKNDEYKPLSEDGERIVDEIIKKNSSLLNNKAFLTGFGVLTQIRNDFNHSGMRKHPLPSIKIKEKLDDLVPKICELVLTSPSPLFINFSNHPSSGWSKAQLNAAAGYGKIIDLPFPAVDPDADESAILALADEYVQKIEEMSEGSNATVHIMGEMTLCYHVIGRLLSNGIRCVASTAVRNVTEGTEGKRIGVFEFKAFREYEN